MTSKGFGKTILFNEHFVVYGIPSIVSAIYRYTTAEVRRFDGMECKIIDNRKAAPGYKEEKLEQQKKSVENIFDAMELLPSDNWVEIELGGNLYASSGVGASAASCVAIARALSDYYLITLSDEEINEIAYEGEKAYHGNPSGVDNTASTFGGLIWFKREPREVERIDIEPVEVVLGYSGKTANTTAAIEGVRKRKEENPRQYNEIFYCANELAHSARKALEENDLKEVGHLMNINHQLLQEIEISTPELDELVELSVENGAYGAKLTGGGLGGNMVALTPGKDLQERVSSAIEEKGYEATKTLIGAKSF